MDRILECVPNFSEGNNQTVIEEIGNSIESVAHVKLLDIDPGRAAHRTVFTFAGEPEKVIEAAFQSIKKAGELIDMQLHKGEHPRMGATDVCPLIPVKGISIEEAVQLSHILGKRVGEELHIPVYLYEQSAQHEHKRNFANIRKGEYEGLPNKITHPDWEPDYGKPYFNPKSGATVIGARDFLIAYNVNLNTANQKIAHQIARQIRSSGYKTTYPNGHKIQIPGKFEYLKAIGWYIEEFGKAQISMNLTNFRITGLHHVYEEIKKLAQQQNAEVTGSELVGMIPEKALLDAANFYTDKEKITLNDHEKIYWVIEKLGLNEVKTFNPEQKILEWKLG